MKTYLKAALTLLAVTSVTSLQAQIYTAIQCPTGTVGNQQLPADQTQTSGDDFNVNSPIKVYSLGVFDSGSDGLLGTLIARIYDRTTQLSVAEIAFSGNAGNAGTLSGGIRFINLATPLTLPAGFEGIISAAYLGTTLEKDGNLREANPPTWTADMGGGLITFVGEGSHSLMGTGDAYPNIVDPSTSPINFLSASFTYSAVPEPGPAQLAALGLLVLACGQLFKMRSQRRKLND